MPENEKVTRIQEQHQISIDYECGCHYSITIAFLSIPKEYSLPEYFKPCEAHSKRISQFKKKYQK